MNAYRSARARAAFATLTPQQRNARLHEMPLDWLTDGELQSRLEDEERAMVTWRERPEADVWAKRAEATAAEAARRSIRR